MKLLTSRHVLLINPSPLEQEQEQVEEQEEKEEEDGEVSEGESILTLAVFGPSLF